MGKVEERQERQERAAQRQSFDATVSLASTRTAEAITAAVAQMTETEEEIDSKRLTDDERAAALYDRSLSMCEAFLFEECAQAMRRVNELTPGYKGAARLQAWANFRIAGADVAYPLLEPGLKALNEDTLDAGTSDAGADDALDAGGLDAGIDDGTLDAGTNLEADP